MQDHHGPLVYQIFMKFGQNVCLDKIWFWIEYGSSGVRLTLSRGQRCQFSLDLDEIWSEYLLCPPSKKREYIVADVGQSVRLYRKQFPDDNLRTLWPRIMKLHTQREVGHDLQMTPVDFQVSRSRSHASGEIKLFLDCNLITLWPRIIQLYMEIGCDMQMPPIDFEVKGQGHRYQEQ